LVDEHGAHPIAQGEMPEAALALVSQVKVYERLTVTAAVEGSYDAAFEALLSHPLVASYPVAKTVLDGYIEELTGLLHLSVSGRSCLDLTAGCPRLPGKSRTMSRC
jgi:alpha-galactosidase/6-phospho-beta-glucosidase family protein